MIQKLPIGEKIGYALGDMAANFIFQAMLALQLDFYTHTFGLTAAQAGTLFLVVGLGVACSQSRDGRHRGSDHDPLGQIPSLAALDIRAVWHH